MLRLIATTGAAIVDLDAPVDLSQAKAKIGETTCIRGNTQTTLLGFANTPIPTIIEAISSTLLTGKPHGRYMFGAGCEWPWTPRDVALRNLSIAKTLTQKLGTYPGTQ